MTERASPAFLTDDQVQALRQQLATYFTAVGIADEDGADLTQEVLLRVWQQRDRITAASSTGFALIAARNLAVSLHRAQGARERHADVLPAPREPERPDDLVESAAHEQALDEAMAGLSATDREALVAHALDGTSTVELAQQRASTPGGVAAQLARSRARARVDYVLALRGATLPTPACRPVLLALSSGAARRLRETRAGEHLLGCAVCAELSEPLRQRRRGLAWALPLGLGGGLLARWVAQSRRVRTVQLAAAGTSTATVAAVVLVAATLPSEPAVRPAPRPRPVVAAAAVVTPSPSPRPPAADGSVVVTVSGRRVVGLPFPAGFALAEQGGATVRLTRARVLSVPADEGFWVGSDRSRVWVSLLTPAGDESRVQVRPGDRVSGPGTVRTVTARVLRTVQRDDPARATLLRRQHAYLQVPAADLAIR